MLFRSYAFELLAVRSEEASYLASKIDPEPMDEGGDEGTLSAIKTFLAQTSPKAGKTKGSDNANSNIHEQQVNLPRNSDLKTVYRHIVRLCILNRQYCSEVLRMVFNKILSKDVSLIDLCPYYTELMCAISQHSREFTIAPKSCWKVLNSKCCELTDINLLNICVLYFQVLLKTPGEELPRGFVDKVTDGRTSWFGYKVMRQAMRYGHFKIARLLCEKVQKHVATDTLDFYFKSLNRICLAESMLSEGDDHDENLNDALPIYEDSVASLRASIGLSTTDFQLQFLWLRIRTLQVHTSLRQCCRMFDTIVISCTTLLNSIGAIRGAASKNNDKFGMTHLSSIQQVLKASKEFRHIADCYENLIVASSHSDQRSLDYIQLLRSSNIIMADGIDSVFQYGKNLHFINKLSLSSDQELALEHKELEDTCYSLISSIKYTVTTPGIYPSEKTIQPYVLMIQDFSKKLLKCSFIYPRYFFQASNRQLCP